MIWMRMETDSQQRMILLFHFGKDKSLNEFNASQSTCSQSTHYVADDERRPALRPIVGYFSIERLDSWLQITGTNGQSNYCILGLMQCKVQDTRFFYPMDHPETWSVPFIIP